MATETQTQPSLTSDQRATVAGVERALATYERETARLLTPDGRRLYTDDEHERRESELRATRDAAIAAAEAAAAQLMREAETALAVLDHRDPIDALAPAELEKASARRVFVAEDAERLPLGELTARLRGALDADDRALLYLWTRYGARRVEREQEQGRGARTHTDLPALLTALREAEGRFTDPAARQRAQEQHASARAFHRAVAETVRPARVAEMVGQMRASGRYGI